MPLKCPIFAEGGQLTAQLVSINLYALPSGISKLRFFVKSFLIRARTKQLKVILLAAGRSTRWRASLKREPEKLQSYYWKEVNNLLESGKLSKIKPPPLDPNLHKSLAPINMNIPILEIAFDRFSFYGIRNFDVITNRAEESAQDINDFVDKWRKNDRISVTTIPISNEYGICETVYEGFWNNREHPGDLIVGYSDIMWNRPIVEKMLLDKTSDISIIVDEKWQSNYPQQRIWHDELNAELVFGERLKRRISLGKKRYRIDRIGECVHRYHGIPDWFDGHSEERKNLITDILLADDSCIGEIVGLFKFSKSAQELYMREFKELKKKESLLINQWVEVDGYDRVVKLDDFNKILLGCFIEYLIRNAEKKDEHLDVNLITTNGKWAEIDHWGDLFLTQKRLNKKNPYDFYL